MSAHPAGTEAVPRVMGELVSIQYLRGVASMMVVIYHLQPQLQRMGYAGPWLPGLSSGVDIFFVISGLIMWVTTYGKPITPWTFWRRRIARIVPLYWLVTSFVVVVMVAAPTMLQTSRFDLAHIVTSYLFVAWPHPVKQALEPVVMQGWTLNYEMFFYLIFGVFLLARPRWRMIGMVGMLLALVAFGNLPGLRSLTIPQFYTSDLMLEFAMGTGLGWVLTRSDLFARVPRGAGWVALVLGFAFVVLLPAWPGQPPRVVMRGIASTFVVAGALVIEAHGLMRGFRTLKMLGDASYSIYLSHAVTMSAASQTWRKLNLDHLSGGLILFSLVCTAVCALVGWLCYRYLEMPIIHRFQPRHRSGAVTRADALASVGGEAA